MEIPKNTSNEKPAGNMIKKMKEFSLRFIGKEEPVNTTNSGKEENLFIQQQAEKEKKYKEQTAKSNLDLEKKLEELRKRIANPLPQNEERFSSPTPPDEIIEAASSERIIKVCEQKNIPTEIIQLENKEFPRAIIFKQKKVYSANTIRVFRGISNLDSSLLEQVPYASRIVDESGEPTIAKEVKHEVYYLAENPTYENLVAYIKKITPYQSKKAIWEMQEELRDIEDGILMGRSLRQELATHQFRHGGRSYRETGVSPYISASFNPAEAARWSRDGVMVLDIPIEKIEEVTSDEVGIKGELDKKYITAILIHSARIGNPWSKEEEEKNIESAVPELSRFINVPLHSPEETTAIREKQQMKLREQDEPQQKKDSKIIQQKRIEMLIEQFPEAVSLFNRQKTEEFSGEENEIDSYKNLKTFIFDHYADRLEKVGANINNFRYNKEESEYAGNKKYDRENITEIMLLRLRKQAEYTEKIKIERSKAPRLYS